MAQAIEALDNLVSEGRSNIMAKKRKPSGIRKTILAILRALKKKKTVRTKAIEGGLGAAGLSEAQIRRLRGKKR